MHGITIALFWSFITFIRIVLAIFTFMSFSLAQQHRDEKEPTAVILGDLIYGGICVSLLLLTLNQ